MGWKHTITAVLVGLTAALALEKPHCPEEGRFPDPETCGGYYDCVLKSNGKYDAVKDDCRGFIFDSISMTCSNQTKCHSRQERSVPIANPQFSHLCDDSRGFECADCKTLVMCVENQAFIRRCGSGKFCTKRTGFGGAVCYPGEPKSCTCGEGDLFRQDAYDPQKFYSCKSPGANPISYRCPDGMTFDEKTVQCVTESGLPPCTESGSFSISDNCNSYYSCIALRNGWLQRSFACKAGTLFNEQEGTCVDPCPTLVCEAEGHYPDPLDRHYYYECMEINGDLQKTHRMCPIGYMWNPDPNAIEICVIDTIKEEEPFTKCVKKSGLCKDLHKPFGSDQCATDNGGCHENAKCEDTFGSVSCTCKNGYVGNGYKCLAFCESEPCFKDVPCLPLPTAPYYRCGACPTGYIGDGKSCRQEGCVFSLAGNGKHCGSDTDGDGFPDEGLACNNLQCSRDNCPNEANPDQLDFDSDGTGDACDDDADGDGIGSSDNCPLAVNSLQEDLDGDNVGDACDNCRNVTNPNQLDLDSDFLGNECDPDADGDGLVDDNCPYVANNDQKDADDDGLGDVCDNCPNIHNKGQEDNDEDGVGDVCDTDLDSDGDGVQDDLDNCPNLANGHQSDVDGDGQGDVCDEDSDGDGLLDSEDNCPLVPNADQADGNNDGFGDACDDDCDGDGTPDDDDLCPLNPYLGSWQNLTVVAINHRAPPADWEIHDQNKRIQQNSETDGSILLGDTRIGGVDYEGTFSLNGDWNGSIGLIFGYQSNSKFYALTWRNSYTSPSKGGLALKLIDSKTGPSTYLNTALWQSLNTTDQVKILWHNTNIKGTEGSYKWRLLHRPAIGIMRVYIYWGLNLLVDSGNIYDSTLKGGRLGLYCHKQKGVSWTNINFRCADGVTKDMHDDLPEAEKNDEVVSDYNNNWLYGYGYRYTRYSSYRYRYNNRRRNYYYWW